MRSFRTLGATGCLALLVGCMHPAAERAERDRQIGSDAVPGTKLEVKNGYAAIRELSAAHAVLWQSAPALQISLESENAGVFALEIYNAPALAELTVTDGNASVSELTSEVKTRRHYELELTEPGEIQLAFEVASWDESAFKIALMSDVQEAIGRVQDIYRLMNAEPNLDFLLGAGDLTQRGSNSQLERFERELLKLDIPYYTTLGNHELGNTPPPFQDRFGRGSFSFEHRGVRFTLLDSASATLDPTVYDWLDDWLELGAERLHVVGMHVPPIDPSGTRNGSFASRNEANKLLSLLRRGRVDLTLYGHIHSYYKFKNAGIQARISGGGGAIPERFDGIGRHFLVLDFDPVKQSIETRVVRVD